MAVVEGEGLEEDRGHELPPVLDVRVSAVMLPSTLVENVDSEVADTESARHSELSYMLTT